MPIYQYEGVHYDLPDGLSNEEAISKIETHLGKSKSPVEQKAPQKEESSLLDTAKQAGKAFLDAPVAIGETTLSLATMPQQFAATVAGDVVGLMKHGISEEAGKVGQEWGETVRYKPQTELGKKYTSVAEKPFEWLAEGARAAGETTVDLGAPAAVGALVDASIQVLAPMGVFKGVKGAIALKEKVKETTKPPTIQNAQAELGGVKPKDFDISEGTKVGETPITKGKVLDSEGNQRVNSKGNPVAATHRTYKDGTSEIILDTEQINKDFENKEWTKPTMEGVKPLPEDAFYTADEYGRFLLEHEKQHGQYSYEDFITEKVGDPVKLSVDAESTLDNLNNPSAEYHPREALVAKIEAQDFLEKTDRISDKEGIEDVRPVSRAIIEKADQMLEGDGFVLKRQGNYIDKIEIPEEYKGQGLGSLFVKSVENTLIKEGHKESFILSEPQAVGFWEKQGYKKGTVGEEGHVQMSKKLDSPLKRNLKSEYEELTNKAALERVYAERTPETNAPTNFANDAETAESLFKLKTAKDVDKLAVEILLRESNKKGLTPEQRKNIRSSIEGDKIKLTEQEESLKKEIYEPLLKAYKDLVEAGKRDGLLTAKGEEIVFPRIMRKQATSSKPLWESGVGMGQNLKNLKQRTVEGLTEFGKGSQGGLDPSIEKKPSGAKERAIFAYDKNGKRTIVQVLDNGEILQWNKGKVSRFSGKIGDVHSGVNFGGGEFKEARVSEIEKHTPFKYEEDTLAVLAKRIQELREQRRVHETIENFKKSPLFKAQAVKIEKGVEIPEGKRLLADIDRVPSLAGYAVDKRLAEIIEDFARTQDPNMLTAISGVMIKNMMLNPLPHMFNEAMHWYLARGLSGWVTPHKLSTFATTTTEAARSVMTMDKFYTDTIKLGGSLLAPSTRLSTLESSLYKKGLQELEKTGAISNIARATGRTLKQMYDKLSETSSRAMWITRDVMYIQLIKEKMKEGMSHEAAIKEVDRHMPTYKLPSRVGEKVLGAELSRGLSRTLQNPSITVFSRYHHGVVKSMMETGKDVGAITKGDTKAFMHGIDTLAAYGVAALVLYPLADEMAKLMTGNPDAEQRRAGPMHITHAIHEVATGSKDPQAVLAAIFTFNPALLGITQLIVNRQLHSGRPIYQPTDTAGQIASDVGEYAAKQIPQVSTALQTGGEKGGGFPQWAAKQIDVKAPTKQQVEQSNKFKRRAEIASKNRELREKIRARANRE